MPPKRAARSSSRSRIAMTPESIRKASPVKSRSRGRPTKKESEKKAARTASKSASRRSVSKSRVASRSRSSSRSRKVLATPSSAPASTSKKTPKENKPVVEVTAEVADDDDETYTPRLRRNVRNLTQEPPRTRSRIPISPLKTFPSDAVSAPKTQGCSILTCAKTKSVAAFNWIVAAITTIFVVLKRLIVLPFHQISDGWKRVKPADSRLSALLLVLILVATTAAFAYFNPKLVQKAQLVGEKHVAVHFRHARQVVGTKYTQWSGAFLKWATPKLEALGLTTKTVKIN